MIMMTKASVPGIPRRAGYKMKMAVSVLSLSRITPCVAESSKLRITNNIPVHYFGLNAILLNTLTDFQT